MKNTKTVYLVEISVGRKEQKAYVKLIPRLVGGVRVHLVKGRDSASQFPSDTVASVVSDWVYQNFWKRGTPEYDYEDAWHLRKVVTLEKRIQAPAPVPCPKCTPKPMGRPKVLNDLRVRLFYQACGSLRRTARHFKVTPGAIQKSLKRSRR